MSIKRVAVLSGSLLLTLGLAVTTHAATYSVVGGGAQLHIGGGLPLPIQPVNPAATGTMFPTLLIPVAPGASVSVTTAMSSQQQIVMQGPVLSKVPSPNKVGVFTSNPTLYAVATNLGYTWPAGATPGNPVTLNTTKRTGAKTTTFTNAFGSARYSTTLASKFGGPARFKVTTATGAGPVPGASVTIYAIAVPGAGNPPCIHTAFTGGMGGGSAACVAALGVAVPNTLGAAGAPVAAGIATTPGGVGGMAPLPGIGVVNALGTPTGTINLFVFTPMGTMAGFTNMAQTQGFPFTAGKVTVSAPLAAGVGEKFTITGMDNRTAGGAGTIQLVAGALGRRTLSGDNANRAWLQLDLAGASVPAVSPLAQGALVSLLLLSGGYMMRRKLFAGGSAA